MDLAAALASLPQLQSVRLDCEELPAGGSAWRSLGQLGNRLQRLDLLLHNYGLAGDASEQGRADSGGQPASATQQLAGLLNLTAVQHLALNITGGGDAQQSALAGLDQLPTLHSLMVQNHARVPEVVWSCEHLTGLSLLYSLLPGMPEAVGCQLSSLRQLALSSCSAAQAGFPAALCTLSQLTALVIDAYHRWGPDGRSIPVALPPQLSQLRQAQPSELEGKGR